MMALSVETSPVECERSDMTVIEFKRQRNDEQIVLWRHGVFESVDEGWPRRLPAALQHFKALMETLCVDGEDTVRKSAIDPVKMPGVLSGVQLLQCVPVSTGSNAFLRLPQTKHRFLVRVVGTGIVTVVGADYTGRYLDEIYSADMMVVMNQVYEKIIEQRRPHFWRNTHAAETDDEQHYERVLYPLSNEAGEISHLIGYWTFEV